MFILKFGKILKSAVDLPTQSRRLKRRAKRDREVYPPRIALTVSCVGVARRDQTTGDHRILHVTVEGITEDGSICKGFNLPTVQAVTTMGMLRRYGIKLL